MLVKKSNKKTNYILNVRFKDSDYSSFWYYDDEKTLFKAYNQLKHIKNIEVKYPIVLV